MRFITIVAIVALILALATPVVAAENVFTLAGAFAGAVTPGGGPASVPGCGLASATIAVQTVTTQLPIPVYCGPALACVCFDWHPGSLIQITGTIGTNADGRPVLIARTLAAPAVPVTR